MWGQGLDGGGDGGWLWFGDAGGYVREAEKEEEGGERLGGSHVERRRECQLLNTYPLSQRVWRGTVPCCNSLIKTNNTHTHIHTHTHTPPALLPPPALIESSLCAIRYLLFSPAKSNLLIFPECLSLPSPLPMVHPSYQIAEKPSSSVCPD